MEIVNNQDESEMDVLNENEKEADSAAQEIDFKMN